MKFLRIKKTSLILTLLLSGGVTTDIFADDNTTNTSTVDKQVQLLSAQAAALQQQLAQLQTQLAQLQASKATPVTVAATSTPTTTTATATTKPATKPATTAATPATTNTTNTTATTTKPATPSNLPGIPYGGRGDLANLGGTAVITAPFIRSSRQFAGMDLIVNYSTIKKNVAIMQQNKNFVNEMESLGLTVPNYPFLELSGNVEGGFSTIEHFDDKHTTDLNLTNAELDMQAEVSPWVSGFMSFAYDDGSSDGGRRIDNSNVFLDNGFITVGNFNKSHFYGTIGQLYVPFGSFSTDAISDPFDKILFRTKGRPLVLGYNSTQATGLDTSVYGFKGDTRDGTKPEDEVVTDQGDTKSSEINQFGGDLVYHFNMGGALIGLGGSVINNVADSNGMQFTGFDDGEFEGFGVSDDDEIIKHNVPGADVRTDISYGPDFFVVEYASATEEFSPEDLTFNGHGAQPSAFHVENDYSFVVFRRPSTFTLAYDQSNEALALNVPRRGYTVAASTSIFKNTLETIEFHHYVNYSSGDTASGNEGVVFGPEGHTSNGFLAHIDAYF